MVPLYLSPKVTKSVHVIAFLIIIVIIINILNLRLLQSRLFWICDLRSCCVRHRWILERRRSSLWWVKFAITFIIVTHHHDTLLVSSFIQPRLRYYDWHLFSRQIKAFGAIASSSVVFHLHHHHYRFCYRRRNQGGRPMDWGDKQDDDKQLDDNMMSTSNWMITWWGHVIGW